MPNCMIVTQPLDRVIQEAKDTGCPLKTCGYDGKENSSINSILKQMIVLRNEIAMSVVTTSSQ
jgi:hypothetical protein